MARQLAKYGIEALKPHLVSGGWHKPKISARRAAELKKEFLEEGKEWPVPEEVKKATKFGFGLKRKPKGHKHDRVAAERQKTIAENMKDMPNKIAAYRDSRKLKPASALDELLLTQKEKRMKQFRGQK